MSKACVDYYFWFGATPFPTEVP